MLIARFSKYVFLLLKKINNTQFKIHNTKIKIQNVAPDQNLAFEYL